METKPIIDHAMPPEKDLVAEERLRLQKLLHDRIPYMVSDYKTLIKHTGGLVSASMGVAYARGLSDALKLLLKGE